MISTDTHFYDGKLSDIVAFMRPEIDRAKLTPIEIQTKNLFELKNHLTVNSLACYGVIVNTLQIHKKSKSSPNYDAINDMFACDLLWLLYEKIVVEGSNDHVVLLREAFEDMNTGLCPVGRTVRLLSVLVMLRDDLTPTSKVVH